MKNVQSSKGMWFMSMVLVVLVFLALFGGTKTAQGQVKELKWAVFVPESAYDSPPLKRFKEDVERYTNGVVKIRIFWPGQIAEVKEMVELVKRGSIDMSSTAPTFYPSLFPLNVTLQSFPMLLKSPEQSTYVWRGLFREFQELQKEFTAQNQYCLNRGTLALYWTLSKKPIRTASDFKGLKVRSLPGKYFSKIMEQAGAVPIVNPISEVYEGLMRGTLDAVMLNVQIFDSLKFYETAKYVSLSVGCPVGYWISINLDTWNSFTPQVRDGIMRAVNEWGERLLNLVTSTSDASIKNLKQKGVQFVEFSPKEWEAMIAKVGDPWVAAKDYLVTDLKVAPGLADRFLKRWLELANEYDKKYTAGKTWKYE